jgi:DNA-directed RNA polymerase subunit F
VPKKELKDRNITIAEAKGLLQSINEEQLEQFQRRSLDFVTKFAKIDADVATTLLDKLVKDFGLEENEAIQIINCMPKSIGELRVFLASSHRIMETNKLEAILNLLNEYQKKE